MSFHTFLSQFKIRPRLIILTSLLIIISLSLCGVAIYFLARHTLLNNLEREMENTTKTMVNMVRAAVDVSVRNHLRATAEKNFEILTTIYKEYTSGSMSEQEAKTLASKILLSQKIGDTGYIYCLDSTGRLDLHPNKLLVDKNISQWPFVHQQLKKKTDYIEYEWANPGEKSPRAKALYMIYFEPWDWIISVSSYREEFNSLVKSSDFRDKVASIRLGNSGYVFILDSQGHIIVHPWAKGNLLDYAKEFNHEFVTLILNQKRGSITYDWLDNGKDETRKKIVVFDYLPERKWIVVTSMYSDEVYAPLNQIQYIVLSVIAFSLILALPFNTLLSLSITKPVENLVCLFSQAQQGNMNVRSKNNAQDELGALAQKFNTFMDQLQRTEKKLLTEIQIRKESEFQRLLFEEVFNNALEGISITDTAGNIISINPGFTAITGYEAHEVIGKNPNILKSDVHEQAFYDEMWKSILRDGHWVGEIWNRRKNGEAYPELLSISAIRDELGKIRNYVAVFHDITEMKSKEEQLNYQAHHDALTGLPNRTLLMDRISIAISHAQRNENKLALFFIDLDNFKHINDSLGHAMGDRLLQLTTKRFSLLFRNQDTIARLGGDEFVIMVVDFSNELQLINLAKRMIAAFSAPFALDEHKLFITASIGIAVFPDDGNDPGTLVKNADIAMYKAKEHGKNNYHMFRRELHDQVERRVQVESALRQSVINEEFVVHYQPKFNLLTNDIIGLEALVRWERSTGELISPLEFIPLAEETGLIIPIGRLVSEHGCRTQRIIKEKTGRDLSMAINLSARQFMESNLLDMLDNIVRTHHVNPKLLEFEITESVLMHDVDDTVKTLNNLSKMGFSLSIDDFGTGYSSLAYLKAFPIHTLKVDRTFVRDITSNQDDARIVRTVVDMSRNLGLDVVAEGVETVEQAQLLRDVGCTKAQGYLYGKPMPLDELLDFLMPS